MSTAHKQSGCYRILRESASFVTFDAGEMAERSNAAVLKTVEPARAPGVRIPLSPLLSAEALAKADFLIN